MTSQHQDTEIVRSFDSSALPKLHGAALDSAVFRYQPEDFIVDEVIDDNFSLQGEHLWLKILKRDQNTSWVAGLLAELSGIPRNDVGYCGLKDRFAVTTQWYSLHLPGRELPLGALEHRDFTILLARRHHRKARRGMHRGNRFQIVLRDLEVDVEAVAARLDTIRQWGVPNYFAEQRFGNGGENLKRAQELIDKNQLKGNRRGTGIVLSAARAWLFNLVLADCIENHKDVLVNSSAADGPLWGRGRSPATGELADIENRVAQDWKDWCYALEHAGLTQQRRALLMRPEEFASQWISPATLQLKFRLPVGSYATALLREIAELSRPHKPHAMLY